MATRTLSIAQTIDHALLHPTLTDDEIVAGCREAIEFGVASVCVKPYAVPLAAAELHGTSVAVGTVIGFPHGSTPSEVKAYETTWAVERGATEVDMVVNIGKVLAGEWKFVENDIAAVVQAAKARGARVKVIFETDLVTDSAAKIELCRICGRLGVDFVKTSTGFGFVKQSGSGYGYRGATEDDIRLMREHSPARVGVKASGGIRSRDEAAKFLELGATRLGTSATRAICESERTDETSY